MNGVCSRFRLVVGHVVPLHLLLLGRGVCRRGGEPSLRVHLPAAGVASEQLAGLHGEHPAAPHEACHISSNRIKQELENTKILRGLANLRGARAVVDLGRLSSGDRSCASADAPPGDNANRHPPHRQPTLNGRHSREPNSCSGGLHLWIWTCPVWSSVAVKWQLGSLWSGRLIYLVWSFQACVRLLYIYRRATGVPVWIRSGMWYPFIGEGWSELFLPSCTKGGDPPPCLIFCSLVKIFLPWSWWLSNLNCCKKENWNKKRILQEGKGLCAFV